MSMIQLIASSQRTSPSIPIYILSKDRHGAWLESQRPTWQQWLKATLTAINPSAWAQLPDESGQCAAVVLIADPKKPLEALGPLARQLPEGSYAIESPEGFDEAALAMGWALGAYQYTRFKSKEKDEAKQPQLVVSDEIYSAITPMVDGIYLARDLINCPASHMGPENLAEQVKQLAEEHGADFQAIVGEELLKHNFNGVYTVGQASAQAPRLCELNWGDKNAPLLCLVGKGVTFDSGGLDLKPASGMLNMKKDMGGSAIVLGLAHAIMAKALPVQLKVLIPAVENAVSGNAYRPKDVIKHYNGLTVEVGNTDAEGRLVLADALAYASGFKPDCLIDIATLTGAARVALGTDVPALFCNQVEVGQALANASQQIEDWLWQLPLYQPYAKHLKSDIADCSSTSSVGFGGAINAALFLEKFVDSDTLWIHMDVMAWNSQDKPHGRKGGEAMGLRALLHWLSERYI